MATRPPKDTAPADDGDQAAQDTPVDAPQAPATDAPATDTPEDGAVAPADAVAPTSDPFAGAPSVPEVPGTPRPLADALSDERKQELVENGVVDPDTGWYRRGFPAPAR